MVEETPGPAHVEPDLPSGRPEAKAGRVRFASLLNSVFPVVLVLSILAVYAQAVHFEFINCDDDLYVLNNAQVQAGLMPASVRWAFTSAVASNWLPVTLLSHMLDVQLFGLESGMHHLTNVLLHAMAAVLLFLALRRATGAPWPSAFVSLMFALHPLHVESVAWISERKDVLSTFFWFLALYGYVRYAERPSFGRYLAVLGPFCLGLMSKPMPVTFPFTLLLLDIWPLRRWQWPRIVWEKLPLMALSAGACIVTYVVQRATGAVDQVIPPGARIANALISYVTYVGQMFWPSHLAVFYPYPRAVPTWQAAAALAVVLSVSGLAIQWRTRPYYAVGWFWYLGTLTPVIGLVQVGEQSHADRYTYVPMVGVTVMLAWGVVDLVRQWPRTKPAVAAAATLLSLVCIALAWSQAAYWQNSESLYQHAIDVTPGNWWAQENLGSYLGNQQGRRAEAVEHFEAALRMNPDSVQANNNFGICLMTAGLCGAAIPHFEAAIRAKPDFAEARDNLGRCLMEGQHYGAAIPHFEAALRIKPDFAEAHLDLGLALSKIRGKALEAIAQYETVLRLSPNHPGVHQALGELFNSLGRREEGRSQFEAEQRVASGPETPKIIEPLPAGQR